MFGYKTRTYRIFQGTYQDPKAIQATQNPILQSVSTDNIIMLP